MWKINVLVLATLTGLGVFKPNLIAFFSHLVQPLLKFYSRNIPVEKAAATGINLIIIYTALVLLGFNLRDKILIGLKIFAQNYSSPINLAVFRIVVFLMAFTYLDFDLFFKLASFHSKVLVPPVGMGLILKVLPPSKLLLLILLAIFIPSTLLAIVGYKTRISSIVSTISGIYLLGMPNYYGKVDHFNHQIWFMFILSCSRCGDAFSIDKIKTRKETPNSTEYSVPLIVSWFLLGLMYLFPGIWKLGFSWIDWFMTDNLKFTMIEKYLESDFLPVIPIYQNPLLYKSIGLFTIIFELLFIFLIFIPRFRLIAIASAVGFHLGVYFQMGINFLWLLVYFSMFLRWDKVFNKKSDHIIGITSTAFKWPQRIWVTLCIVFGLSGIVNGWPISCYPAFAAIKTNALVSIEVVHQRGNSEVLIDLTGLKETLGSQRLWVLTDQRNKMFKENLKKLRILVSSHYEIPINEIVFYKITKDLTHYPQVNIINRDKIEL